MTHLRKMMLEELQRRNYSEHTVRAYVRIIRELSAHFRQPPDRLGPEHMRLFQAHLFRERKLNARTIVQYSAALRFFFENGSGLESSALRSVTPSRVIHPGLLDAVLVGHMKIAQYDRALVHTECRTAMAPV